MNNPSYQIFRNKLYKRLVDLKVIEDTEENYELFDTTLGDMSELDIDWFDNTEPTMIVADLETSGLGFDLPKHISERILVVGHGSGLTIGEVVQDSLNVKEILKESLIIKNYRIEDYQDFEENGSKYIKSGNKKNWKKD